MAESEPDPVIPNPSGPSRRSCFTSLCSSSSGGGGEGSDLCEGEGEAGGDGDAGGRFLVGETMGSMDRSSPWQKISSRSCSRARWRCEAALVRIASRALKRVAAPASRPWEMDEVGRREGGRRGGRLSRRTWSAVSRC